MANVNDCTVNINDLCSLVTNRNGLNIKKGESLKLGLQCTTYISGFYCYEDKPVSEKNGPAIIHPGWI